MLLYAYIHTAIPIVVRKVCEAGGGRREAGEIEDLDGCIEGGGRDVEIGPRTAGHMLYTPWFRIGAYFYLDIVPRRRRQCFTHTIHV